MGCCGGRYPAPARGAGATTTRTGGSSSGSAPDAIAPAPPLRLSYHGTRPATVIGPVTGRRYRVDPAAPSVVVDPRDQRGLLATAHFTRGR